MNTIVIIIMLCGSTDTVIVKQPDMKPVYTHNVTHPETLANLKVILSKKPTVIVYNDDRDLCV